MSTARFSMSFRKPYLHSISFANACGLVYSLGVLVLPSGKFDMGQSLLELDVPVKVVGVEDFLPPVDLDSGLFACLGKSAKDSLLTHLDEGNGVRHIEGHVTIHLDRIVFPDRLLMLL